ncbi:kanamycin kinase [Parafrankia colletiae]|uniref:Kanamycin kinase n=1 Tax=Parafrankia colletiae TaxID=573497 RepID=A0A1S1R5Z7_9ACTN|nr:ROK family protein [Parafrankia colletiae]OHV41159.1 kanamycin kinase [Parafrankia colletiae]
MTAPRVTGRLGIDVGGTKVALRLETTNQGTTSLEATSHEATSHEAGGRSREAVFRWSVGAPAETDLRDLGAGVRALCDGWDGQVTAIGVAMPATVDSDGRVTTWPSRPSWAGLQLGQALRDLVPGAQVALADDGDLAALAEAHHAGAANLVYLGVGTGIGGGIVLDGRLCPGPARGSCEIGHLVIALDGPLCRCGRRGCLQALASGPATLHRATRLRAHPAGAADAEVTYPQLQAGWEGGESWAQEAVEATAQALAGAITGLTELVRPDLAVIGGGFADGLAGFVDAVAARTEAMARPGHPAVPVRAARGGLSSLTGAVLLARDLERPDRPDRPDEPGR